MLEATCVHSCHVFFLFRGLDLFSEIVARVTELSLAAKGAIINSNIRGLAGQVYVTAIIIAGNKIG